LPLGKTFNCEFPPKQIVSFKPAFTKIEGSTEIVNTFAIPLHPFNVGVTLIILTTELEELLIA